VEAKVTPYAVIYSLFGGYILPRGGKIWIGSLVRSLAALNFSEKMVRTTVSRMKQAGYLESCRTGHHSFYRLTKPGLEEVQRTGSRAFETSSPEWDGKWTILVYSIPEEQRELRDILRTTLKLHGFGLLVPGVWISPYSMPVDTEKKIQKSGAWHYLEMFRSEHIGSRHTSDFVTSIWPQLPTLASRYQAYIKKYKRMLEQFGKKTFSDEKCFALRLQCLFDFISVILEDPGLPSALLPAEWPRSAALSLYVESRNTWAEPAERFFNEIYKQGEVVGGER